MNDGLQQEKENNTMNIDGTIMQMDSYEQNMNPNLTDALHT